MYVLNGFNLYAIAGLFLLKLLIFTSCSDRQDATDSGRVSADEVDELTEFEMVHGIGPITEPVEWKEIDMQRAQRGAEIFDTRCAACHRMERRFVGPPLGKVTENRSKEFVMNFILNPEEMTDRHPIGQSLLQEYMTIMPYQNVTKEQAWEIVDFLRHYAETGEDIRD